MTALSPIHPLVSTRSNRSIRAPQALAYMPEGARLTLARFTIWRLRQAPMLKTSMLALCLACLAGVLGFVLAQPPVLAFPDVPSADTPRLEAALPASAEPQSVRTEFPDARSWGVLQAEILRLRLLLNRIAESADLAEGEFGLFVQLADERYRNSLLVEAQHDTPPIEAERFTLAKRAVNHMTDYAQVMLSITQRQQRSRKVTLSGSPVVRAKITSRYGYRIDPRSGTKRFHRGLDFGGEKGSKVLALADGVVTYAGKNGGYGNLVELEHADGYRTRYAHNEANLVSLGDKVDKGQVIATMGSTGKSTGTHVHVEVRRDGRAVDPLQFVSTEW